MFAVFLMSLLSQLEIIRHLQYLRKRALPSKSLVVASGVELEEDFNDV